MQAIQTTYYGPTDTKGSRIGARCEAGRLTVAYDHSVGRDENHRAAAQALAQRLGWTTDFYGPLVSGELPSGDGAHVFLGRR